MSVLLQEVTMPGCVHCAAFKRLWTEKIGKDFPAVTYQEVDAMSPEGQEMVAHHGILASPGIVINGELFSVGGVNEKALRERLTQLGTA